MPTLQFQGATIHYGDSGADNESGAPDDVLVLLHAAGNSGGLWRGVVPRFTVRFRVLTPDLYGHGQTDFWPDPETMTHDDQAALVRAVVDDVRAKNNIPPAPIWLVGHSYGGGAALRYALNDPGGVRSLVLIEPMVSCLLEELGEVETLETLWKMSKGFLKNLAESGPETAWRTFLDFRNGPGTWEKYPEKTRQRFIARTQGQVANLHSNHNNRLRVAELRGLTMPALVMRSEHATVFDARMVEIVAAAIPGCNTVELADAEHMAPLNKPDLVADEIERHFQ
jgi:pimeloyl-ACP methyl ester carboxylesterase